MTRPRACLWTTMAVIILAGCGQNSGAEVAGKALAVATGPGYWFHLIFIVLPLLIILVKLFRDMREIQESLFTLEGQMKRLLSRLDEVEAEKSEKQISPSQAGTSARTKDKPTKAKSAAKKKRK